MNMNYDRNVNFENMKNEQDIVDQAIRMIEQVSTRNKYQALLNPMTPQELRIAKAFNRELNAHDDYCEKRRQSKHTKSFLGDRMRQKDIYYAESKSEAFYLVRCYANGKEINAPFGNCVYRTYSDHQNELMQNYCVGICMGLHCKYKHPSVEIVWRNYGVETPIASFNR